MEFADPLTGRLDLFAILTQLRAESMISEENHTVLRSVRSNVSGDDRSALKIIAECGWQNQKQPGSLITLDVLLRWFSEKINVPIGKIDPLNIDVASITGVMSLAYARRFNIIALEVTATSVTIGTAEPFDNRWQQELSAVLRKSIVCVLVNPDDIQRFLHEFYNVSKSVLGAKREQSGGAPSNVQNLEQLMELGRKGKLDANDQHVVNIVDWLLQYAYEQRASDIHLEPGRTDGVVRFRIDGVLHQVYEVPATVMAAITSRIKILGRMDVAEKRRPQDGRLKTRNEAGREVELRLSTMPTAFGEKLVMRVFDPDVLLKDAAALGFTGREQTLWNGMLKAPHGIILVTGPTGSGKTTTLYTSLRQLATPEVNLCTVEDPIELIVPAFNQMQVQSNIDLDFASGVRTLLRQDPDIIMIGEIRDHETAQMAIQAALTGHLVISTLHTNDAPSAITRLLELGVPYYLLRNTIVGVLAQRLVRTLCQSCATTIDIETDAWASLIEPCKIEPPTEIKVNTGCDVCRNTGYAGRIGIYEIMEMTGDLKSAIKSEVDVNVLRMQAIRDGMEPLRISGARKVGKGLTSIAEIQRVAPPILD
ncbi:type II secretion system protein E [Chromatiales bacterium (ex Bugula neritina AB1)]|nr:type II secretion system protein E [Chromatiales bacterium (ex Bugula neritina AB1)]